MVMDQNNIGQNTWRWTKNSIIHLASHYKFIDTFILKLDTQDHDFFVYFLCLSKSILTFQHPLNT